MSVQCQGKIETHLPARRPESYKMSAFHLKNRHFSFAVSKIYLPLRRFQSINEEKVMKQMLNINLLNIIILLGHLVGSECFAVC